jgi:hypothetical protein
MATFAVTATLSTVLIVGWCIGRLGEATPGEDQRGCPGSVSRRARRTVVRQWVTPPTEPAR